MMIWQYNAILCTLPMPTHHKYMFENGKKENEGNVFSFNHSTWLYCVQYTLDWVVPSSYIKSIFRCTLTEKMLTKEINRIATTIQTQVENARTHSHIYTRQGLGVRRATTKTINTLSECTILQENHRLLSSMLLSSLLLVFDVVDATIFIVSFISYHSGCWSCYCIITMFHYNLSTRRWSERERMNM